MLTLKLACFSPRPDVDVCGPVPRGVVPEHHDRDPECVCVPRPSLLQSYSPRHIPAHQGTQGLDFFISSFSPLDAWLQKNVAGQMNNQNYHKVSYWFFL